MIPERLNFLAELLGFLSSAALAWQTFRLVRHQRVARDLRNLSEQRRGTRAGELAEEGAAKLDQLIGRWDARDQWLVFTGVAGLALSFLLKLVSLTLL
jgi:hypothetical protein